MIKFSIVTLSYNTKDLTLACLNSIVSQYKDELEKNEIEIIVLDNNSSDGSQKEILNIKEKVSNLKLIESKENLGFSKGCNLGAKEAKGKYVLFLNSDTKTADKGFLKMAEFLDSNTKVAVLGGKLENSDGTPQPSCGKFYTLFNLLLMLLGFERLGLLRSSPNMIKRVDWVSGACMMINREFFNKISGFDEKLFMYVEDMEICYRAKKLGFSTYFYSSIKLEHKSLASSSSTFAIINIYKGILHFYSKHRTNFEYLIAKTLLVVKAGILIFVGFLTFNAELKKRYLKAII
jgi:GT2 family glycosyltransferase